jgi:hypothetical protein
LGNEVTAGGAAGAASFAYFSSLQKKSRWGVGGDARAVRGGGNFRHDSYIALMSNAIIAGSVVIGKSGQKTTKAGCE